jgi:glyoxylase-like metal-dependent hydrolase (beta-lactamase superfamily II)
MAMPIAERWFETRRLADDVTLIREPHVSADVRCNMWHVRGRDRDLLLDTGMGMASLSAEVALVTERPVLAVASHTHFDHVGGHHEFAERLVHPAEAGILAAPTRDNTLAGRTVTADIFTAYHKPGFDPSAYSIAPAAPTRLIGDGEVIDLGDRRFEVLHLPGHSPGSIALWEKAGGILFSGDVVYDGPLYDDLYHSVPEHYVASMERLKGLPVETIHGGHYESFGRARMIELIDDYLAGRRGGGCPLRTRATASPQPI